MTVQLRPGALSRIKYAFAELVSSAEVISSYTNFQVKGSIFAITYYFIESCMEWEWVHAWNGSGCMHGMGVGACMEWEWVHAYIPKAFPTQLKQHNIYMTLSTAAIAAESSYLFLAQICPLHLNPHLR